jgi:hypothetical protein
MQFRNRSLAALTLAVVLGVASGCSSANKSPVGMTVDTVAPSVIATNPLDRATSTAVMTAVFSEAMDAKTISTTTFAIIGPDGTSVRGGVTYDASTEVARFSPSSALAAGTAYTATITTGAKDLAGNALPGNVVWGFTTLPTAGMLAAPDLGSAGTFAVLAGATVTNTGETTVTGDLGVSPGTAVTGFPPGILVGAMHAGDPASAQAIVDLTKAYADAAGRTLAPVLISGNLGGRNLRPGLYKSTSSLAVSSGDLMLDAQGDPNAVFIFQMASTLTLTSGRAVFLSGGARASNIFWQVGSSATLGTTSVCQGTIMADQSITLNTGATLNGRALARIGAVTLDGNAIVVPSAGPATSVPVPERHRPDKM